MGIDLAWEKIVWDGGEPVRQANGCRSFGEKVFGGQRFVWVEGRLL